MSKPQQQPRIPLVRKPAGATLDSFEPTLDTSKGFVQVPFDFDFRPYEEEDIDNA
jgi:hypothetical protein